MPSLDRMNWLGERRQSSPRDASWVTLRTVERTNSLDPQLLGLSDKVGQDCLTRSFEIYLTILSNFVTMKKNLEGDVLAPFKE